MPYARKPIPWHYRLAYRRIFPWVFHVASLLFAAVHLYNFTLQGTPWWLFPLLVLPQWLTGMVLGWLRVKRGIGASMLLHGKIGRASCRERVWQYVSISVVAV